MRNDNEKMARAGRENYNGNMMTWRGKGEKRDESYE
jgi:hypothetical protein